MTINKQEIVNAFSETVGEEKAEMAFENAASQTGLGRNQRFDKDEAIELVTWVADDDVNSLLRVSANTVKHRSEPAI